jgi:hypothetical protein
MTGVVHVLAAPPPPDPGTPPPPPPPGTPPPPADPGSPPPGSPPPPAPPPGTPEPPVDPAGGGAPVDAVKPRLTSPRVQANARRVRLQIRLDEAARVTVVVTRGKRTLARRVYGRRRAGFSTFTVRRPFTAGRLVIRVRAVDPAGNATTRTLRVRVRVP